MTSFAGADSTKVPGGKLDDSWKVLFEPHPEMVGKIAMIKPDAIYFAAALYLGLDQCTENAGRRAEDLQPDRVAEIGGQDLCRQCRRARSDPQRRGRRDHDRQRLSTIAARKTMPTLEYVFPKEGVSVWSPIISLISGQGEECRGIAKTFPQLDDGAEERRRGREFHRRRRQHQGRRRLPRSRPARGAGGERAARAFQPPDPDGAVLGRGQRPARGRVLGARRPLSRHGGARPDIAAALAQRRSKSEQRAGSDRRRPRDPSLWRQSSTHRPILWRNRQAPVTGDPDVDLFARLAQTAERGKFDAIFLGDSFGLKDDKAGLKGMEDSGSALIFEPMTPMAALALATKRIGLRRHGLDQATATPFAIARQLRLDRPYQRRPDGLERGDLSAFDAEAQNCLALPARSWSSAERYARAE